MPNLLDASMRVEGGGLKLLLHGQRRSELSQVVPQEEVAQRESQQFHRQRAAVGEDMWGKRHCEKRHHLGRVSEREWQ